MAPLPHFACRLPDLVRILARDSISFSLSLSWCISLTPNRSRLSVDSCLLANNALCLLAASTCPPPFHARLVIFSRSFRASQRSESETTCAASQSRNVSTAFWSSLPIGTSQSLFYVFCLTLTLTAAAAAAVDCALSVQPLAYWPSRN